MADNNNVIGIKFGVLGGDSTKGETSGAQIKADLESIANNIKLFVKVGVDEKHFEDQVQSLKKLLEKELGSIDINLKTREAKAGNSGDSTVDAKKQEAAYKSVIKTLEQLYQAKVRLAKTGANTVENVKIKQQAEELRKTYRSQFAELKKILGAEDDRIKKIQQYGGEMGRVFAIYQKQLPVSDVAMSKLGIRVQSIQTDQGYDKIIARNKDARDAVNSLIEEFNRLRAMDIVPKEEFDAFNKKLFDTESLLKKTGRETDTLGNKIRETFNTQVVQRIAQMLLMLLVKALKQVYTNVKEVDEAMTELRIVTNANEKAYKDFTKSVVASAKAIGASVTDLIKSTTTFARLGYSLQDARVLAEKTTQYSNVSGVDAEEATTNITSIVKAFKVESSDLEGVIDQLIWVGNNFAISSGEIGVGMNNAASALAANGNTLQEAIGILTAANVTVQDASKSSTAVRTIAARISGSTAELNELGETEDVLATADLDAKMRAFGVAVVDANGNLRSTYEILNDVSAIWDELNNAEQAALAKMLAGTRQQNAFYSIMQNWNDAKTIVTDASEGYGSLKTAQEDYINSIQGKTEQLKATWTDFSTNVLNSDLIKFFIDLLNVISKALNWIMSLGGDVGSKIMGTAVITVAAIALISGALKGATISFTAFKAAIVGGLKAIGTALLNLAKNPYMYITLMVSLFAGFADKMPAWSLIICAVIFAIGAAVAITLNSINASVHAFMASNPLGWILAIITAIVMAITALIKGIAAIVNRSTKEMEEAVDKAKESKQEWEDAVNDLKDVDDQIEETRNRIKELQDLTNKGTITLVEQDELDKLQNTVRQLEAERKLLQDIADAKKDTANRDAANALNKILAEGLSDAYVQEDNTFWMGVGRSLSSVFSFGISDAFGFGISDWTIKHTTAGDYVKEILGNWENATEQQISYVQDFYKRLAEQKEMLSYYTGDNLEQWQKDANDAYNTYYEYTHRFLLANNNAAAVWDSVLSMERFGGIEDVLREWANSGEVSTSTIKSLYNNNPAFKELVDYLTEIGMFSWNSSEKVSGLVNQINALADSAKRVESISFLKILDGISGKFDALKDALDSVTESGIVAADAIQTLLDEYPSLEKYFKFTKRGYVLNDKYTSWTVNDVLNDFATGYLQTYVDELNKWEVGTENYITAQNNLNNAIAVMATLLRSVAIEEQTKALDVQKDALKNQLKAYKSLIEIRKDLLSTYKEELEYQKQLTEKQKSVADLQTRLALAKLDNSASGAARVRELEEELSKAQDELDDYTLEHAISDITDTLDKAYDEYSKFIDGEVDRLEDAISKIAESIQVDVKLPNASADSSVGNNIATDAVHSPWKSYEDAASDGYPNIRTRNEFLRGNNADKTQYGTYQNYLDAMYRKYKGSYHMGGFVGDISHLKSNEVFAKLLNTEFVATPQMMDRFIRNTLPELVTKSDDVNMRVEIQNLLSVQGNVTEDALPDLKTILDKAVEKMQEVFKSSLSRSGYRRSI